jgi:hypothetical protein
MARFQPSILAGLFIGVLSALPFVSYANFCCCLWVVVGGVLVAYLKQQNSVTPVDPSDAALGGLVAGVIGAVIASTAMVVIIFLGGDLFQEAIRGALESNSQIPERFRETVLRFLTPRNFAILIYVISIPVYAVFGMLGGLLGIALFAKKPPAQPQA